MKKKCSSKKCSTSAYMKDSLNFFSYKVFLYHSWKNIVEK